MEIEPDRYTGEALRDKAKQERGYLTRDDLELWFARKPRPQTGGNGEGVGSGTALKWTRLENAAGAINGHGYIYRVTRVDQAEIHELSEHSRLAMF